jgi:hypothetical protein
MQFAGIFAIIVGLGMIGQWGMSYTTKQIPELETEPIRIWFHIAAEMVTAVLLITGGISMLLGTAWGRDIFLISVGMLFYTAIVSPGYFAQKGSWAWLAMFSAIILLGIVSVLLVI